jgi:hypothetical protein
MGVSSLPEPRHDAKSGCSPDAPTRQDQRRSSQPHFDNPGNPTLRQPRRHPRRLNETLSTNNASGAYQQGACSRRSGRRVEATHRAFIERLRSEAQNSQSLTRSLGPESSKHGRRCSSLRRIRADGLAVPGLHSRDAVDPPPLTLFRQPTGSVCQCRSRCDRAVRDSVELGAPTSVLLQARPYRIH